MAGAISSINELAALVGKSAPAVQKWLKHPDWTFGRPPWPARTVKQIQAWAAETLQEDRRVEGGGGGKANPNLTIARLQKLIRETGILDVNLRRMKGEVHDVEECTQKKITQALFVKNQILTMLPSTAAQEIDARQRSMGKAMSVLELAEVITRHAETTLNEYVAKAGHKAGK